MWHHICQPEGSQVVLLKHKHAGDEGDWGCGGSQVLFKMEILEAGGIEE